MKKIVFALIAAAALNVSAETVRVCVNVGDGDACQWFTVPVRAASPAAPAQGCYIEVGDAGKQPCPSTYGKVFNKINEAFANAGFTAAPEAPIYLN